MFLPRSNNPNPTPMGKNDMKFIRKTVIVLPVAALILFLSGTVLLTASPAHTAEGGYTNYWPGFYGDFGVAVAPDPGNYFEQFLYGYPADGGGHRFVQNGEIRADVDLSSVMYAAVGLKVLEKKVLGGSFGFGGWMPVTYQDMSFSLDIGPASRSVEDDLTGIGDIGIV